MRMRADDEACSAVDEMAEALLLARRLGVEIEDRGIRLLPERAGGENRLGASLARSGILRHAFFHPRELFGRGGDVVA